MSFRCHIGALLFAWSMMSLWGCGNSGPRTPPGQPLTIVISSQGKPMTGAQVALSGIGGSAELNENGEAILRSVPYGEYQVVVSPVLPEEMIIPQAEPSTAAPKPIANIPKQYRDETTTPLKVTVQAGSPARVEFELTK